MFGKRCLLKTKTRLQSTTMNKMEQQRVKLLGSMLSWYVEYFVFDKLAGPLLATFMLPEFPQKMFDSWYSVCKLIFSIIKKNAKSGGV